MARTHRRFLTAVIGAVALTASTALPASARSSAPSATTPKYGGDISVGIFDTFSGFCVGNNLANSALMAARTMYDTLFEKTVGGDMIGLLATGSSSSDDLKTWTVNLRSGVKFHDGSDFNAAAVVTNFNAIRGMTHLTKFSTGGARYLLGTAVAFSANIVNVTAVDDLTVKFTLDRPQNDVPASLYASGRFVMRAPAQLNSEADCAVKPIGTGPFKLSKWTPNDLIVTKNTSYWRKDPNTNASLPYLDSITFTNVKEGSQRSAAVRKGTIDAAMFSSATDSTFIQDLHKRKSLLREYRSARDYYAAIWLNQGKATSPFSNRDARLAVSYAFDAASFAKIRTKGESQRADSIVGPSNVMYNRTGYIKYNLKKAKQAAAHYKETTGKTLEFTMPFDSSTSSAANATLIKQMMAKAGIKMNILPQETAVTLTQAFNVQTGGNDFDAIWLLLLEGNDASFNLPFLVTNMFPATSVNPAKALKGAFGSLLGLSHHSDVTVDADLFSGQAAKTKSEAKKFYRDAVARIQSEALVLPTVRQYYVVYTTKKLNGIGKLQLQKGKTQRITTNWGIDWTGVWKA